MTRKRTPIPAPTPMATAVDGGAAGGAFSRTTVMKPSSAISEDCCEDRAPSLQAPLGNARATVGATKVKHVVEEHRGYFLHLLDVLAIREHGTHCKAIIARGEGDERRRRRRRRRRGPNALITPMVGDLRVIINGPGVAAANNAPNTRPVGLRRLWIEIGGCWRRAPEGGANAIHIDRCVWTTVCHIRGSHASLDLCNAPIPVICGCAGIVIHCCRIHTPLDGNNAVGLSGVSHIRVGRHCPRSAQGRIPMPILRRRAAVGKDGGLVVEANVEPLIQATSSHLVDAHSRLRGRRVEIVGARLHAPFGWVFARTRLNGVRVEVERLGEEAALPKIGHALASLWHVHLGERRILGIGRDHAPTLQEPPIEVRVVV
eukprot:scaffold119885_cov31-Tisochrysis_lutea.AAC.2